MIVFAHVIVTRYFQSDERFGAFPAGTILAVVGFNPDTSDFCLNPNDEATYQVWVDGSNFAPVPSDLSWDEVESMATFFRTMTADTPVPVAPPASCADPLPHHAIDRV